LEKIEQNSKNFTKKHQNPLILLQ